MFNHLLTRKCSCGGEPEMIVDFVADFEVRCSKCHLSTHAYIKPEDAAKFLLVRGIKNLAIFEVNIRKNSKSLAESFDHSFTFFKCRAFIYTKDIPLENITNYAVYNFD